MYYTDEQKRAYYEQQKWEHEHPFRTLFYEIIEELPIIYLFVGWLSFFALLSKNHYVFYTGVSLAAIWLALVAYVMADDY